MTKIWQDHDHLLPNAPGKISGVIAFDDTPGRKTMTVQCAACLRTVTDMPILAANEISYARGYEIPGSGCMWSESGTYDYRRCSDCRKAGRHPEHWQERLPLRTQTTRNELGVVTTLRGVNAPKLTTVPLDTVAASGNHHGLLVPYYSASETAKPTSEPVGTLTTVDRYALIDTPAIEPEDCSFRMLEPHEIAAGMSFPLDYQWSGTKRERVRLAGNAVTPPAARDLVHAVVASI